MMRLKWFWIGFGLMTPIVSSVLLVLWVNAVDNDHRPLVPGPTLANARRLREGMTIKEVSEILGGPGSPMALLESRGSYVRWAATRIEIVVEFEEWRNGRLVGVATYQHAANEEGGRPIPRQNILPCGRNTWDLFARLRRGVADD